MVEKEASNGDSLLVLDTVDEPRTMEPQGKSEEIHEEFSGGGQPDRRSSKRRDRERSRSPISGPGARRGNRRGGYRGWDRSAEDIGNKTNSEDPYLQRARIFVGNIATDRVSRRDLSELFGQYGKVLGVSIHGGFAFVQMDRESNANRAVVSEDNQMFKGSKLHIEFSQAALKAGAKRVQKSQYSPPPPPPPYHPKEREREYGLRSLEDQLAREERLARVLDMEREMAYIQAREDLYSEMYARSQVEPVPPQLSAFDRTREDGYRRPPLSPPPPSNPYASSREREFPMDRSERLDDRRPYYSRSEAASSSSRPPPPDSRTDLLSYPLPRNRSGGNGPRGADVLAAAYGGAATSGKSVGYGVMAGSGSYGGQGKSPASGGYSANKPPNSGSNPPPGWPSSSSNYQRGGSGSRGPFSSGYWN